MNELVRLLTDAERPGRVVYGVASGDNTVAVRGSATAVEMPALAPVKSGDYCAVWEQGADRLILGPVGSDWTAFTPSWTNLTPGNATVSADYRYTSGGIRVRVTLVWGSTTSASGNLGVTIPNSERSRSGARSLGQCQYIDAGVRVWDGSAVCNASSTSILLNHDQSGNAGSVNGTNPFTFATGDSIVVDITVAL